MRICTSVYVFEYAKYLHYMTNISPIWIRLRSKSAILRYAIFFIFFTCSYLEWRSMYIQCIRISIMYSQSIYIDFSPFGWQRHTISYNFFYICYPGALTLTKDTLSNFWITLDELTPFKWQAKWSDYIDSEDGESPTLWVFFEMKDKSWTI